MHKDTYECRHKLICGFKLVQQVQFVEEVRTDEVSVSDTSTNTPWSSVTGGVWEVRSYCIFCFLMGFIGGGEG